MRMKTVCNKELEISSTINKKICFNFDGGNITQDGGLALVRQIDDGLHISESICKAVEDKRNEEKIEHTFISLIRQKLYQLVCGYEDGNELVYLCREHHEKLHFFGGDKTKKRPMEPDRDIALACRKLQSMRSKCGKKLLIDNVSRIATDLYSNYYEKN